MISENPYFICPKCAQIGEPPVHLVERARVIEGTRYCGTCGDEIAGNVTMDVFTLATNKLITWKSSGGTHSLGIKVLDPRGNVEYTLYMECHCIGAMGKIAVTYQANQFSFFFNEFSTFVEDAKHFTDLKKIIEALDHASNNN